MVKSDRYADVLRSGLAALGMVLASMTAASALDGVALNDARMHIGPATNYPLVETIPAGTKILIDGCTEGKGWCMAQYGGRHGWILSESVDITGITRPVNKFEDELVVVDVTGQVEASLAHQAEINRRNQSVDVDRFDRRRRRDDRIADRKNRRFDRREIEDGWWPPLRSDYRRRAGLINDYCFRDIDFYNTSSSDRYNLTGRYYDRRFGQYYGAKVIDVYDIPLLRYRLRNC